MTLQVRCMCDCGTPCLFGRIASEPRCTFEIVGLPEPEPEPDEDTLDTRAVLAAFCGEEWAKHEDKDWHDAKHALTTIKDRTRREAIQALPDDPTDALQQTTDFMLNHTYVRTVMAALKRVYG